MLIHRSRGRLELPMTYGDLAERSIDGAAEGRGLVLVAHATVCGLSMIGGRRTFPILRRRMGAIGPVPACGEAFEPQGAT